MTTLIVFADAKFYVDSELQCHLIGRRACDLPENVSPQCQLRFGSVAIESVSYDLLSKRLFGSCRSMIVRSLQAEAVTKFCEYITSVAEFVDAGFDFEAKFVSSPCDTVELRSLITEQEEERGAA